MICITTTQAVTSCCWNSVRLKKTKNISETGKKDLGSKKEKYFRKGKDVIKTIASLNVLVHDVINLLCYETLKIGIEIGISRD